MGKNPRQKPRRLGRKLCQIRAALGLSQNQILRKMGLDDKYSRNNLSNYETDKREAPLPILLGYARLAGISVDDIIDDKLPLPKHLPDFAPKKRASHKKLRQPFTS